MYKTLVLICMLCALNGYGQRILSEHHAVSITPGLEVKLFDKIPLEFSLMVMHKSKIGFMLRLTKGTYNLKDDFAAAYYDQYRVSYGQIPIDIPKQYEVNAFAIKPSCVFIIGSSKHANMVGVGYCFVSSDNTFTLQYKDPAFGSTDIVFKEHLNYHSAETFYRKAIFLDNRISLNITALLGLKFTQEYPFSKHFNGLDAVTTYSPAQGYGANGYFNFILGLSYKLF